MKVDRLDLDAGLCESRARRVKQPLDLERAIIYAHHSSGDRHLSILDFRAQSSHPRLLPPKASVIASLYWKEECPV